MTVPPMRTYILTPGVSFVYKTENGEAIAFYAKIVGNTIHLDVGQMVKVE